MAASTSTSMASSPKNPTRFDVFLSFRGEDTRDSFNDHLYAGFKRAGIRTFRDNDEIRRGQNLEPEIVKAIKDSKASVVVLSENYAKSRWCLDELLLILEQRRDCDHFVLPVFYHVDPSDVRNQRQNFAIEAKEGVEGSKWTLVNVNRWKLALLEVANLTGMVASGSETELIAEILNAIDNEVDLRLISTPAHLTGMETRAEDINSWLKNEHSNNEVLAICGMGGSETSSYRHFWGKDEMISCVFEGTHKIEEALHMKKVLIVLDDIDDHDELGALVGTNAIHAQSKIIITTRLLDIPAWFESISWKCHVHILKLLTDHESLKVLSCHAFGSKIPKEGFSDLAKELSQYCGGNPLALKVLGSSLFVSAEEPRETNSIIEVWRSRLDALKSLKGDLGSKIQDEDYVVKILEHDCHAKAGIMTLINKCLLTVSPSKKLMMHQLLQDMGRNIVREESKDPVKHTRVWCSDEAYRLLTKGDGSETIEGLALDTRKLKKGTKVLSIKTGSLAKMDKLKLLQLKYVQLTGSYKNFPELRWLSWDGCHLKKIPSGFPMCSLVSLDMTNGILKMFEPPMVLYSLKFLNFKRCTKLVSIRNLNRLPKLETLNFWACRRLTHVFESIGGLKSLALLNLRGCKKLWKVSSKHEVVNHLKRLNTLCNDGGIPEQSLFPLTRSLKYLFLDSCDLGYKNDARVVIHGPLLSGLSLCDNPFEFLPNNIDLNMLRVLNLSYCDNLKSILSPKYTRGVVYTSVYKGCFKLSEVEGLFKFESIAKLDEADLGHMKWVKGYQDYTVDLVGDENTKGRIWHIQMLCEYGIKSTYLQGIKDENMLTHEYASSSSFLSFRLPLDLKAHGIQGLNVTTLYRSSGFEDNDWCCFFAIMISNKTKGFTWIYNPVMHCKPKVDEDVAWLSYWPIGNILNAGDEVRVDIISERGLVVSWFGASIMYMNDSEVEQEENWENNKKKEEVIGGDLSEFEVTPGVYYLCRRDFFKSNVMTYAWVKRLFGGNVHHKELQDWRKSYQSHNLDALMDVTSSMELYRDTLLKRIWLGNFDSENEIRKIKKAVSRLEGVNFVDYHIDRKRLYVTGSFDCMAVETCVREFQKTVKILHVSYYTKRLMKRCPKKIVIRKRGKNKVPKYISWYMFSSRKKFF